MRYCSCHTRERSSCVYCEYVEPRDIRIAELEAQVKFWRNKVCDSSMCPQESDPDHTCTYCKGQWATAKAKETP